MHHPVNPIIKYTMRSLLIVLFCCLPAWVYGQIPVIHWQKTIGGSGNDRLVSMKHTPDGAFILGGFSASGISGEKTVANSGLEDYWIIKMDSTGNILWQRDYGGQHNDYLASVILTSDGGYLAIGGSESGVTGSRTCANYGTVGNLNTGRDFWVLKLDATGLIQWQQCYGTSGNDGGLTVMQRPDNGFLMGGITLQPGGALNNGGLIRTDLNGNRIWNTTYGGNQHDAITCIAELPGTNFVVTGHADSPPNSGNKTAPSWGGRDTWVLKTDSLGNIIWQTTLGGTAYDAAAGNTRLSNDGGVFINKAGEIVLSNVSSSGANGNKTTAPRGSADYWIVALDSVTGAIVWQDAFGGSSGDTMTFMIQTADSGYLLAGYSLSGISGDKDGYSRGRNDYWILKLGKNRNIEWQQTIGGSGDDHLMTVLETGRNEYLLGGYSNSDISGEKTDSCRGNYDWWIIKLAPCDTVPVYVDTSFCRGTGYPLPGGRIVTAPGIYSDTLRKVNMPCDSIVITDLSWYPDSVYLLDEAALGRDTAFCSDIQYELRAEYPGASYLWSTGSTMPAIAVTFSGDYSVQVTSPYGCIARDSVRITLLPVPEVHLGADTGICDTHLPYELTSAQPAGAQYRWSTGLTTPQITISRSGTLWLEVILDRCAASDTIEIQVIHLPDFRIGRDTIFCEQYPLRIGTYIPGASYLWNTGDTSSFIQVNRTGMYELLADIQGCVAADTVHLIAIPAPGIDLGTDRDICEQQTLTLDASWPDSRYQWNTGDTTPVLPVTSAGFYWVKVIDPNHCVATDSVRLHYYPKPDIFLGQDTVVCEETPLILKPWHINADSLQWSGGSTGWTLAVRQGGEYIASAINKCGVKADTIFINQIFCDIMVPNAFSPNGDGVNDLFRVLGNTGRLEGFTLSVYNRWGERLFYTNDRRSGWDGRYKGGEVQMGAYVYMLEYSISGKSYLQKGSFHLLR